MCTCDDGLLQLVEPTVSACLHSSSSSSSRSLLARADPHPSSFLSPTVLLLGSQFVTSAAIRPSLPTSHPHPHPPHTPLFLLRQSVSELSHLCTVAGMGGGEVCEGVTV